ncbi:hypothetical protein HDE_06146 [Halotydeus destructor]|nr:hypothetical protein HDE_06146 [Halotydeus destructor]
MAGARPTWTLLLVTTLCAVAHAAQSADVEYSDSVNFSYQAPREEDVKKLMSAKIMSAGKISRPEVGNYDDAISDIGDEHLDSLSGSKQTSILSLLNSPLAPPTGDGIASTRRKRGSDTSKLEIFSEGEPVTIAKTLQKNPDKSLYVEIEIPQPRQVSFTWSFRDTKNTMRSERSLDEIHKFCVQFILSPTDGSEPVTSNCLSPEDAEEPLDLGVNPEKEYRISSRIKYFNGDVTTDPDASDEFETIDLATAITRKQDTVSSTETTDTSTGTTGPSTATTGPSTETTDPSTGSTGTSTEPADKATGTTGPSTQPADKATGTTGPSTETPDPSTGSTDPSTEPADKATGTTGPSTKTTDPSTGSTGPSTEPTNTSTGTTVSPTETTDTSTGTTGPSTATTGPSTQPADQATGTTGPSTKTTDPSTGSTGPSTETTEKSTGTTGPSTEPADKATGTTGLSTETPDPSTASISLSTEPADKATGSTGQSTEPADRATGTTGPSTETTDKATGTTGPSTEPTEKATGTTGPSTQPADTSTELTVPTTERRISSTEPASSVEPEPKSEPAKIYSEGKAVSIIKPLSVISGKSLQVEIEIPESDKISITWSLLDLTKKAKSKRSVEERDKLCVQFILSPSDGGKAEETACLVQDEPENKVDVDVNPGKEYEVSSKVVYYKDTVPTDLASIPVDEFETVILATAMTRKQSEAVATSPVTGSTEAEVTSKTTPIPNVDITAAPKIHRDLGDKPAEVTLPLQAFGNVNNRELDTSVHQISGDVIAVGWSLKYLETRLKSITFICVKLSLTQDTDVVVDSKCEDNEFSVVTNGKVEFNVKRNTTYDIGYRIEYKKALANKVLVSETGYIFSINTQDALQGVTDKASTTGEPTARPVTRGTTKIPVTAATPKVPKVPTRQPWLPQPRPTRAPRTPPTKKPIVTAAPPTTSTKATAITDEPIPEEPVTVSSEGSEKSTKPADEPEVTTQPTVPRLDDPINVTVALKSMADKELEVALSQTVPDKMSLAFLIQQARRARRAAEEQVGFCVSFDLRSTSANISTECIQPNSTDGDMRGDTEITVVPDTEYNVYYSIQYNNSADESKTAETEMLITLVTKVSAPVEKNKFAIMAWVLAFIVAFFVIAFICYCKQRKAKIRDQELANGDLNDIRLTPLATDEGGHDNHATSI